MTPNNRAVLSFGLLALFLLLPVAGATIVRSAGFDEKVDNAESIILGKCLKTRSEWDPTHRAILTYSTFRVEETLKGQPAQEVTVITPGGSVDGIHQSTIGIPAFQEGNEHIVFVKNTPVGRTVLYFEQGTYEVERDGTERVVRPIATDAVKVDSQRGMAVTSEEPRTLREFRDAIRASERRTAANRMALIAKSRQQPTGSLSTVILRYKWLLALALAGVALATWHLLRR